MSNLDDFFGSSTKEKEVKEVTPVNTNIAVPNNDDSNKEVIVSTYMQKIEITRYPNGTEYQKVTMWKQGAAKKTGKRKVKKTKKKSKKTIIQKEESY